MHRLAYLEVLTIAAFSVAACTGARDTELDDPGAASLTQPTEPAPSGDEPAANGDGAPAPKNGGSSSSSSSSGGTTTGGCKWKDGIDHDGDGLSYLDGDCDDCDATVRPGKIDVAGNGIDEDCSGKVDDDVACDGSVALASTDALDAAKAIGVCHVLKASTKGGWGVVSAKYVNPDGTPLGSDLSHGLLPSFGANSPVNGKAMLALSTGAARAPGQADYVAELDKKYAHGTPAGWPKASPACTGGVAPSATAKDGAALELTIKVPIDARSMSFDHALFSKDFSGYVCSKYTDPFVVIMDPPPAGAVDGNIVFDALGGAIGASSPLLDVCAAGTFQGITFPCTKGTAPLADTGFEGHGATGWLRTTAPVEPGSTVTLLFAVWDSGDATYDTTVLLDGLRFWTQPVTKTQTVAK